MHKFVRNLITEWRRLGLPVDGTRVIAAVSGGADSAALLIALADLKKRKKLGLDLIAAHFDHGLRPESAAEAGFVASLCESLSTGFIGGKMSAFARSNLEEFARRERYRFLEEAAKSVSAAIVLTAHTRNDQAETLLMNLIRGSGPGGLAAMQPIRRLTPASEVLLARPFLEWAGRTDTEGFCRDLGVDFLIDPMNEDPSFTRTRIRRELIPKLREFNPRIVETLARTAAVLRSSGSQLDLQPAEFLMVGQMQPLSTGELHSTLRNWLKARRGSLRSINLKHIQALERLIVSRKSGRVVELPGGGLVVKQKGRIAFVQAGEAAKKPGSDEQAGPI